MSELERIEKAVQTLNREQLLEFQRWFDAFVAQQWDHAFEKDASTGRLDAVADEALKEFEQGRFKEL